MQRAEQTETTMGAALRRAGVNDAPARLMALAVKCLRASGGDVAAAARELDLKASGDVDLVSAAFSHYVRAVAASMAGTDLRGGGRNCGADSGQDVLAAATQPSERSTGQESAANIGRENGAGWRSPLAEDEGRRSDATVAGHKGFASSSAPQREAAGQTEPADAIGHVARAEPSPVRNPNPPRGADVIGRIQAVVGKSIFDKIKLADGTPWSDVCYRELFGLARDGGIAAAILKDIPMPRDDGAKVSGLISEARFAQLVAAAGGRAS